MAEDLKYVTISAKLVTKTGLRVGGTETSMDIGGAENPVIRDYYGMPYIPGSSLKGKIRSLLEYNTGHRGMNGEPCGCGKPDCPVCKVFGAHKNTRHTLGPSRIIFRDAYLTEESKAIVAKQEKEGKAFSEVKTETMINRDTGMAFGGSLRTQERVPAGTSFDLNISLRVFKGDNETDILAFVKKGLDLLPKDALGGAGTRGYGWVEITDLKIDGKAWS